MCPPNDSKAKLFEAVRNFLLKDTFVCIFCEKLFSQVAKKLRNFKKQFVLIKEIRDIFLFYFACSLYHITLKVLEQHVNIGKA